MSDLRIADVAGQLSAINKNFQNLEKKVHGTLDDLRKRVEELERSGSRAVDQYQMPQFSGEGAGIDALAWWNQVSGLIEIQRLSEREALVLISLALTKRASAWWWMILKRKGYDPLRGSVDAVTSVEEFEKAFTEEFAPVDVAFNQLLDLKQGNLSLEEYMDAFGSLATQVSGRHMSDQIQKNLFCNGLRSCEMRMHMRAVQDSKTLVSLFQHARMMNQVCEEAESEQSDRRRKRLRN